MRRNASPPTLAVLALVAVLGLALPAYVYAKGLPFGVDTSAGVASTDGLRTYAADSAKGMTIVERTDDGEASESVEIEGTYAVPGVAMDGTTSGLSADESTLVLIEPRRAFPLESIEMVVLDPGTLEVRERIALEGDFSYDALSPDGATLYLIEYTDPRDPTRYRVRAYDMASGELAPEPIVDKSEPEERMRGFPMTRVTGIGGRWEYTLYDGSGHEPFVHALDTVAGEALCIDLPWVDHRRVYRTDLELVDGGATISVNDRSSGPVASIDTATGEAGPIGAGDEPEPASDEPEHAPAADVADEGGIGGGIVALIVLGTGTLIAFVLLATGGLRRGR